LNRIFQSKSRFLGGGKKKGEKKNANRSYRGKKKPCEGGRASKTSTSSVFEGKAKKSSPLIPHSGKKTSR